MANITRNFIAGRMNKVVDERLLPDGEYVDAMNVRMGSTELSEVGVITNTKGNLPLTSLTYIDGTPLSSSARCIGAIEDSANETIYWFVHDPSFSLGATGKLDLVVSFNVYTNVLRYHIISIDDGGGLSTTLNFNPTYLITGVDIIENLLFFTDDYNAPRQIDITKNYANPVGNIDAFDGESILVIKRPPVEAPQIQLITTSGQENYLQDRFISFAYRYEYDNGEYSATSQWSEIAFIPNPFNFSINSMLNEGMTNFCNTAIVSYNSGGPLVIGIDLLFKQANNNVIKVIEKINKAESGLADNQIYQFSFNNSKIFTVLSPAEILRLYDNVPRFAKAQTLMGNRLMYGNYVEGYDLEDKNGQPIKLEYSANLITEEIGLTNVPDNTQSGNYQINGPTSIPNSVVFIDLAAANLVAGSFISLNIKFVHSSFTGNTPFPVETTDETEITFDFFLNSDYSSVYALASSVEFQEAVGTAANILPVYDPTPGAETSCDGVTFTDAFNCILPNNLDSLQKVTSGITNIDQPIKIITTPASTQIGFQLCAMRYVNNPTAPTQTVYEYYTISYADATFQEIGNPKSLHSNRGYEIGIVYMDEFNRASTALVSPNNAVHIACGFSKNKNSIRVNIPPTQRAPYWATRYKFVIKPDEENYETIYSNLFFTDPLSNSVWFLLEGENTKKVEVGDRLIVKSDSNGAKTNCAYATVLEKTAQASGFIDPVGYDITVPAGLYIKINPNSFAAVLDPDAIVKIPAQERCAPKGGNYTISRQTVNIDRGVGFDPLNPTWQYEDYSIPAGSIITLTFDWNRAGVGSSCERRGYTFERRLTASSNYDNLMDWWNGDNVGALLNTGFSKDGSTSLQYIPTVGYLNSTDFSTMYIQFDRIVSTNRLVLQFSTGKSCTGVGYPNSRKYCVTTGIEVLRAVDLIIFETEPQDALPDIFFENNLSFGIDVDGNHLGNIQDQTTSAPAIVDTGFFNCFSFGNGAESYKIRDSIIGRSFNLGERVTTVAEQDYEEVDRFADITYSGNYNLETNVNRLNEFNKGLSNYKNCEASFGEIFILDGRETDVLVLQEDKISYVLAEKNLLSDASAGNIITATPEVLGTQLARTEKYGISFNPESYVQWGYDRYFTDVKRGAVIQIKGDSGQSDQLVVVSDQNMRTWFRDTFNASFNTQKLGGFDPYMNEYVLSTNDELLPINEQCLSCGVNQTFTLSTGTELSKEFKYCVSLGPLVGTTQVSWVFTNIEPSATLNVEVNYNGTIVSSGPVSADGSIFFNKNNILVQTAEITLTYTGDMVVDVLADCCEAEPLNIVEVVITNNSEAGQTIHTQYRYTDGAFVGPLLSNLVLFQSGTGTPLVSRYNITSGFVGSGGFPPELSTMRLSTNKIVPDTFDFDLAQDKFKYLRSNTLYANTNTDIQSLLLSASTATPNSGSTPLFYADFTVPASSNGVYLYLIWDLRDSIPAELCFATTVVDACCDCTPGNYYLNASFENSTSIFTDINMTTFAANGFYSDNGIVRELVDGVLLPVQNCGPCATEAQLCFGEDENDVCCNCELTCDTPYNSYIANNSKGTSAGSVGIYNQYGVYEQIAVPAGTTLTICSIGTPVSLNPLVLVSIFFNSCICPQPIDCGETVSGSGGQGVYQINVDTGTDTGAIVIGFNPLSIPDGIRVTYDGVVYNGISSPIQGFVQSPNPGHFTIIGSLGATGSCSSWYPSGQTQTNDVFIYSPETSLFENSGLQQTDVISPAPNDDFFILSGGFGLSKMVIPKPSAAPSALLVEIIGPCPSTGWDIEIGCPFPILDQFYGSDVFGSSSVPCSTPRPNIYNLIRVSNTIGGFLGLYDYVFEDENGEFPLPDGFYASTSVQAPNGVFEVANGVIVNFSPCI